MVLTSLIFGVGILWAGQWLVQLVQVRQQARFGELLDAEVARRKAEADAERLRLQSEIDAERDRILNHSGFRTSEGDETTNSPKNRDGIGANS